MQRQFFALVGSKGAGKSTLFDQLKKIAPRDTCVFLCDSSGAGDNAPHIPFTTRVTEITKAGIHEAATPLSQLLLFWARLVNVIEHDVVPNLKAGKTVFMDGFGGTILANARCHARSETEREQLTDLHKSMITHCVIKLGVPPPAYLWLSPSPEVAYARLLKQGRLPSSNNPQAHIAKMNAEFSFYGTLPGQTVLHINADQTPDQVLEEVLDHIDPHRSMMIAV